MKVVFIKTVRNVAKAGQVKEVADGYARNYLLPKQIALQEKPGVLAMVEAQMKKGKISVEDLQGMYDRLQGAEITFYAKTGAQERLHGAITSADIADELEKTLEIEVDKRKIELEDPIHHLGEYQVVIKLGQEVSPTITVKVVEEKEEAEAVQAEAAAPETEEVKAEEPAAEEAVEEAAAETEAEAAEDTEAKE